MFTQLLSQGKLLRLPSPQSLYHVTFDGNEAVSQSKGIGSGLGRTRRSVGSRHERRISGQAHPPEGHLRNGEVVNGLNERLLGRHHKSQE